MDDADRSQFFIDNIDGKGFSCLSPGDCKGFSTGWKIPSRQTPLFAIVTVAVVIFHDDGGYCSCFFLFSN
jgi:hypothetical protein